MQNNNHDYEITWETQKGNLNKNHTLDIIEQVVVYEPRRFRTSMTIINSHKCPLRTRLNRAHWPRFKLALILQYTIGLDYSHRKFPMNMAPRILVPQQPINPAISIRHVITVFSFTLNRRLPTGIYKSPQCSCHHTSQLQSPKWPGNQNLHQIKIKASTQPQLQT